MAELAERLKTKDVRPRAGECIKPGEIIGIPGMEEWTLADRRTWNLLLFNAWGDRLDVPNAEFTIPLRDLRGLHDSNDRVRASLYRLQKTLVLARLADGATRSVQMLGACDLNDSDRTEGLLRYDFHPKLVPLLLRSEIYARMELKIITAMTSKYSLALYEVLALRVNLRRTIEEVSLETLREWLSVEKKKLVRWVDFNRFALTPAIQEVNMLTPFDVSVSPVKQGQKIVRVRVSWAKKEPFKPAERVAAQEANRLKDGQVSKVGRHLYSIVQELTPEEIQKGYEAAAPICRLDKDTAYRDWRTMVSQFETPPSNLVGHFIDFCKRRARAAT